MSNYVLDETITKVLQHSRLSRYELPTLVEVENFAPNLYSVELVARENVINSEQYSERDVRSLNHHFEYLKNKCLIEAQNLDTKFWVEYNKASWELKMYGQTTVDIQKNQLICDNFVAKNQFFLNVDLRFLTISRATYDRNGRIYFLKFRIIPIVSR